MEDPLKESDTETFHLNLKYEEKPYSIQRIDDITLIVVGRDTYEVIDWIDSSYPNKLSAEVKIVPKEVIQKLVQIIMIKTQAWLMEQDFRNPTPQTETSTKDDNTDTNFV